MLRPGLAVRSERGWEADNRQVFRDKFVKGFLDWLLTSLVSGSPSHGYQIMQAIKRDFNVDLNPGTLYPILYSLESRGLVQGERASFGGKGRKVYRLTPSGWRFYLDGREYLQTIVGNLLRHDGLPLSLEVKTTILRHRVSP